MESDQNTFDCLTRANQNGAVCNNIKYIGKIAHRKYESTKKRVCLRSANFSTY